MYELVRIIPARPLTFKDTPLNLGAKTVKVWVVIDSAVEVILTTGMPITLKSWPHAYDQSQNYNGHQNYHARSYKESKIRLLLLFLFLLKLIMAEDVKFLFDVDLDKIFDMSLPLGDIRNIVLIYHNFIH